MRFRTVATTAVLILIATQGSAVAQAPAPPGIAQHQAAIHALRDSQMVRLHTSALARHQGRLLHNDSEALVLAQGADSSLTIPLGEVDSLWVRGSAWKAGAIVGAAVGVVLGFAAGLSVSELACECGDPSAGLGFMGGIVGGAGGALAGGMFGSAIKKWRLRFP